MEYAGAASGAALGFMYGNVPGMFIGGRLGYLAGKKRKREFEGPKQIENPAKRRKILPTNSSSMVFAPSRRRRFRRSALFYAPRFSRRGSIPRFTRGRVARFRLRGKTRFGKRRGRFVKRKFRRRFRRKFIRRKKLMVDKSKSLGFGSRSETYGVVSDEHCVYLKHSSFYLKNMYQSIAGALVRKLFRQMGVVIGDIMDPIPGQGIGNSAQAYRLLFWKQSVEDGGVIESNKDIVAGSSLFDIVDPDGANSFVSFINFFRDYINNDIQMEPHSLILQVYDTTATNHQFITISSLLLQNEVMHMRCSSVLRYQNRTLSPDGSASTDVVNNQPLSGKLFNFRNGDPRLKYVSFVTNAENALTGVSAIGVDLVRSTTLNSEYQDPPSSSLFSNCVSSSMVTVPVGATQVAQLSYHLQGRLVNSLKKLRCSDAQPDLTPTRYVGIQGRSQMLALEELVKTNSVNPITVGYEREYTVGVWFTSKKSVSVSNRYTSSEVNSVP